MLIDPKLKCYLNDGPTEGIIRIYNLQNDETLLIKSNDVLKDIKNIRFQLDMGIYSNKALQESYKEIGLEVFALEPIATLIESNEKNLDSLYEKCKKDLKKKDIKFFN